MIAIPHDRIDNAHDRFVAMLPAIKQRAHRAFRDQQTEAREELVQEVIANAYVAFARLLPLGKANLALATPLASFAIRQVRSDGRRKP
jgi:DNA-directed RNA polymerase specialized sigma24 family protein